MFAISIRRVYRGRCRSPLGVVIREAIDVGGWLRQKSSSAHVGATGRISTPTVAPRTSY